MSSIDKSVQSATMGSQHNIYYAPERANMNETIEKLVRRELNKARSMNNLNFDMPHPRHRSHHNQSSPQRQQYQRPILYQQQVQQSQLQLQQQQQQQQLLQQQNKNNGLKKLKEKFINKLMDKKMRDYTAHEQQLKQHMTSTSGSHH